MLGAFQQNGQYDNEKGWKQGSDSGHEEEG